MDRGGKPKTEPPPAVCYPAGTSISVPVIDSSGIRSLPEPECVTGSLTFDVPGTTAPWDQIVNPTMVFDGYPSDYATATPAVALDLLTLGVQPGAYVGIACVAGTAQAGGLPDTGCDGLTSFAPNNNLYQPACASYYPSAYVDPSNFPVYTFQLIGSFTDDSGFVVGKPFAITSNGQNVQVPDGATKVQVGFNECLYSDNSPAPLTVRIAY